MLEHCWPVGTDHSILAEKAVQTGLVYSNRNNNDLQFSYRSLRRVSYWVINHSNHPTVPLLLMLLMLLLQWFIYIMVAIIAMPTACRSFVCFSPTRANVSLLILRRLWSRFRSIEQSHGYDHWCNEQTFIYLFRQRIGITNCKIYRSSGDRHLYRVPLKMIQHLACDYAVTREYFCPKIFTVWCMLFLQLFFAYKIGVTPNFDFELCNSSSLSCYAIITVMKINELSLPCDDINYVIYLCVTVYIGLHKN